MGSILLAMSAEEMNDDSGMDPPRLVTVSPDPSD